MTRGIAKAAMIFFFATQVLADEGVAKSPKDQPRPAAVKGSQGGVAGISGPECGTDHCCDFCWVGTPSENNCDPAWEFDNDCDCGCQFEDPRCQLCTFCWEGGGTCPAEWQYDLDCDCGCQWPDCGCTGFGECVRDSDCPGDPANCLEGYCDFGDPNDCLDDVCGTRIGPGLVCRPAVAGGCDVDEVCDSAGICPPDVIQPAGTLCRPIAGDCDVPEDCDGTTTVCPPDAFVPVSPPSECRPIAGDCDLPENCDGNGPGCPTDQFAPDTTVCGPAPCLTFCLGNAPECPIIDCNRLSASEKGSLLFFSKIELKWQAVPAPAPPGSFNLTQDTFLTVVNDYPEDVYVQWYFINGDAPLAPQFTGNPPVLVERGHSGWNWVDCNTYLTHDESNYLSAATGSPLGCQPFGILDPGTPPGRPDPEGPAGSRVLRGYAIAFAVDSAGNEISWNHLSGSVAIVNYADRSAWEYNAYGIQCVADVAQGSECRDFNGRGEVAGAPSSALHLDGKQYDFAFDKLLFDFYAVGSQAFTNGLTTVTLDTDLTLYPVDVDLRQDNDGPITTKAKFDIWNQNEDGFSGTTRCITCWDQTLLSSYGALSNFMLGVLHTDKGKARIDGIPSDVCDPPGACCDFIADPDCFPATEHPFIDLDCSVKAALLGVSDKILVFSGAATGRTDAGMTLVGQGEQSAVIRRDLLQPPDPLTTGPEAPSATGLDDASPIPVRPSNRGGRSVLPDKR